MTLIGPDNNPLPSPTPKSTLVITRQMKRAYLRTCALSEINQLYSLEPRRIRRDMALKLAKRDFFISKVREASHAF